MNIGTIITLLILLTAVGLIIFKIIKDKKSGVSYCGCGCGNCPNCGKCRGGSKK